MADRTPLSRFTPGDRGGSRDLREQPMEIGLEQETSHKGPKLIPYEQSEEGSFSDENNWLIEQFRREWDKPFWRDLREQVMTDFAYYTGSGQWTREQIAENADNKKPTLTLNHIKPTCETIFGLERMNRQQPRAAAEGESDRQTAAVFTRLMRRSMYDCDGEYQLSDAFEDGVICGVSMLSLPIRYADDPFNGDIDIEVLRVPEEVMWTTPWRRYDLDDCRIQWRHKWVHVDDLIAQYPDERAKIIEGINRWGLLYPLDRSPQGAVLTEGDPADPYAPSADYRRGQDDRAFWFNEQENACRVLECYFPKYTKVTVLATEDGRRVIRVLDEAKAREIYRQFTSANPSMGLSVVTRIERTVYMKVILPLTGETLEEGYAFEKDKNTFPFVPYFAHLKRDEVFGVVRSLRDAQDEINARRSQIAWLLRATGDGWFVDQGAMVNLAQFESESRDPKGVYEVLPGRPDPRRMPPPSVPQNLFELLRWAQQEIRLISAVNSELTGGGAEDRSLSGVAMQRRQQQGIVATSSLFDNFKRTKRTFYKKLAKRIQEVYTGQRVVRLLNEDTHEEEFVQLNQPTAVDANGQPMAPEEIAQLPGSNPPPGVTLRVLNDISTVKYDVVMIEEPASPTARSAALATLLELLQKAPGVAPLLVESIVELTEGLPNRDRTLKAVKQWAASLAGPQGPPPPKVSVVLRGDVSPQDSQDLLDDSTANSSRGPGAQGGAGGQGPGGPMGAANGNEANPNGQLPTGGAPNALRADLPAR